MSRTYRDPIHKEINLDDSKPVEALLIELIDSREVQRLRWVRQLGTSWFTFHGAENSRFPHSLGAMHVARKMFDHLVKQLEEEPQENPEEENIEEHRAALLCAALLHDIGHGPFSHSSEKIIDIRHEKWTYKLIQSPETEVNKILTEYDPGLPEKVVSILNKTYPLKYLCSIVNSQMDCDRFDYLLRDSHQTGTAYGNFDLNRVISSMGLNKEKDALVISDEKGMLAVEDYLYARYSMYLQVYQHKKSLATEVLLQKLFKRVKVLATRKKLSYIEEAVYNWLMNPQSISIEEFLLVDDINIIHHIKHWTEEKDFILKDLALRFYKRKLFRAYKVAKDESFEEAFATKSEELKAQGLDTDYYLDQTSIASKPYSFYNPGEETPANVIFVQQRSGDLKEISKVSNVVEALVQGDFSNKWLISV